MKYSLEKNSLLERLQCNRGQSSLMVVTVISLLTLTTMSFSGFSLVTQRHGQRVIALKTFLKVRKTLVQQLSHDGVWNAMLNDAWNISQSNRFDCLNGNDSNTDCEGASGRLRIVDTADSIFYNPWASDSPGFTVNAYPCKNADAIVGNDLCPILVEITWRSVCIDQTPCLSPENHIEGKFVISFGGGTFDTKTFNSRHHDFEIFRQSENPG